MTLQHLQVVDGEAVGFLPAPAPDAPLFLRPDPGVSRADLGRMLRRLGEAGMSAAIHELGPYSAVVIDAPADIDVARDALRRAVDEIDESDESDAPPPAAPAPKPSTDRCTVAYADMRRVVDAGSRCATSRGYNPLLDGTVRVRALDGMLTVLGYDSGERIASLAQCQAETAGEVDLVIPYRHLLEWLKAGVPGERLAIFHVQRKEHDDDGKPSVVHELAIRGIKDSGRPAPELNLVAQTTEEYPEISLPDGSEFRLSMPAKAFKKALGQALSCACSDWTRPRICSVAFEFSGRRLLMWATDTHRLIEVGLDLPIDAPDMTVIVQTPGLKKMLSAMPGRGEVALLFSPSLMAMEAGDVLLVAPTYTDGPMPNRHKIGTMAKPHRCMAIPREEFAKAVTMVKKVARQDNRKLIIEPNNANQELLLRAASTKTGTASTGVWIEHAIDHDQKIAACADYLLDALTKLEGDEVLLDIQDPTAPYHLASGEVHIAIMPMQM